MIARFRQDRLTVGAALRGCPFEEIIARKKEFEEGVATEGHPYG